MTTKAKKAAANGSGPTRSDKPALASTLVEAIVTGLPAGVELDEREEALLDLAARQLDAVARAEADIDTRGYLVEGSRGQQVINPSIAEVRQGRLAMAKILAGLDLPESTRDVVQRARAAAEARWGKGR